MVAPVDLTIVVIAYNEEEGIGECLTSLLAQTTSFSFEILVVDDGSTDATPAIVSQLQAADHRVRLLRFDSNRGRGAARLAGQEMSSAPRIAFVDADIIVPKDWLETCARELQGSMAVSGVAIPGGDCAAIWQLFRPGIRFRSHPGHITGNNVMFDAAALKAEPFEQGFRLGEDTRLEHRMKARGMKLKTVPSLVSQHREHKSYREAVRWMWENGMDAAKLPFELRRLRFPDLTWGLWLLSCLVLLAIAAGGWAPLLLCMGLLIAVTVLVNVVYVLSRFTFKPYWVRWLLTATCNLPAMAAYLAGRTFGMAAYLARRTVSPRER